MVVHYHPGLMNFRFWLLILVALTCTAFAAENEPDTYEIIPRLEHANQALKNRPNDHVLVSLLITCTNLLEPLRCAIAQDALVADEFQVRLFAGYIFKYMTQLTGPQLLEAFSPMRSAECLVVLSAVLRIERQFPQYVRLCESLSSIILKDLDSLEFCVNWVLLLTRPVINNVPYFLFLSSIMPIDLFYHFSRHFIQCFGCRETFHYSGFQRTVSSSLPMDTTCFILRMATLVDGSGQPFLDPESAIKVLVNGCEVDPKETVCMDALFLIQGLVDLINKYEKNTRLVMALGAFTFSEGAMKMFATAYQNGNAIVDDYFAAVLERAEHIPGLTELISNQLSLFNDHSLQLFIHSVLSITSVLRLDLNWDNIAHMLHGQTCVQEQEIVLTVALVNKVLIGLLSAGTCPYLSKCKVHCWKRLVAARMNIPSLAQAPYDDLKFNDPEMIVMLYNLYLIYGQEFDYLGKLLTCSMVDGYNLTEMSTFADISDRLRYCHADALIWASASFRTSQSMSLSAMKACATIFNISKRHATPSVVKLFHGFFTSLALYLMLIGRAWWLGAGAADAQAFYANIASQHDVAQLQEVHLLLYQRLTDPHNYEQLKVAQQAGHLQEYVNFISRKRLLCGSLLSSFQSLLES